MMEDIVCTLPVACGERDCPAHWHLQHYWVYADGTYSVCDSDGNHDPCEEDDVPGHDAQRAAWDDYARWVITTGEDPVGEYSVVRTTKTHERWELLYTPSVGCIVLQRARRGGVVYVGHAVPGHVREYACVSGSPTNVVTGFDSPKQFLEVVKGFNDGRELVLGQWYPVMIEHEVPRAPAAVRAELVAAARRGLRRTPA